MSLSYDGDVTVLKRIQDSQGIHYSSFDPQGFPAIVASIPFRSGVTYSFNADGGEQFVPARMELRAPERLIELVSPGRDEFFRPDADLRVAWEGGDGADRLTVAVAPMLRFRQSVPPSEFDFSQFQALFRPFYRSFETPVQEYIIPSDSLRRFDVELEDQSFEIDGIFIQVAQNSSSVVEPDEQTRYMAFLHNGDVRHLRRSDP